MPRAHAPRARQCLSAPPRNAPTAPRCHCPRAPPASSSPERGAHEIAIDIANADDAAPPQRCAMGHRRGRPPVPGGACAVACALRRAECGALSHHGAARATCMALPYVFCRHSKIAPCHCTGELCLTSPAQALRHGAAAALWQRALDGIAPPSPPSVSGEAARDRLAYAVATALGDLFVFRGDDDVAAATLLVALDPRGGAWHAATVHASRPLRVAAAGTYLINRQWLVAASSCSRLEVTPARPPASPR